METEEKLAELLRLTQGSGQPNVNVLWRIAKDLEAIKLNIKFFGYQLAKELAQALPSREGLVFQPFDVSWKPSTQRDLGNPPRK